MPCQAISALWRDGEITAAQPLRDEQIQPSSLDLRLGTTAYRVRASFLPGPGIPTEHHERVFETLFQLGDGLTDKPRGVGLGLSVCRQIASQVGGRIWCERSDLGGARVCLWLPGPEAMAGRDQSRSSG